MLEDPRASDIGSLTSPMFPPIKPDRIEEIASLTGPERLEFEAHFTISPDPILKYRIARSLILHEGFSNPICLYTSFTDPALPIPDNLRGLIEPLRDRLRFLLIQKGDLAPPNNEPGFSERMMQEEISRRENLRSFIEDGWPIEVVGQIATVEMFSNITDEKKLEEYRAWVTRSMLREYVGILSGTKIRRDMPLVDIMHRLPIEVFSDPDKIKYGLIEHYLEQRLIRSVTDAGIQEGLASLETLADSIKDPNKKAFIRAMTERFYAMATQKLKGDFKEEIEIKGSKKTFPNFEQTVFVYYFLHDGTRFISAEPGLGKTGAAYIAEENSDASGVLVLAPAGARETWQIEENKLFKNPGNVFIVESSQDLDQAATGKQKYIVVSHELLGLCEHDPSLIFKLKKLVQERKIDGGIIDEIEGLSNIDATSTRVTQELLELIRQNYDQRDRKLLEHAPIIGMTGTPIRGSLSNMNVPMSLLYPNKYAMTPRESTASKKTFSDFCLNNPHAAYSRLYGAKEMFRWEQATEAQQFSYEVVALEASPFEEYLYAFIANNIGGGFLGKARLLEDCLFNPLLVKAEVRVLARSAILEFDVDMALASLSNLAKKWKVLRGIDHPSKPDDYLSADRLVEFGMGELVLSCFFHGAFENGIDTLVSSYLKDTGSEDLQTLRSFWKPRGISSKYTKLQQVLEEELEWKYGEDGKIYRRKVFVVSPSRRQGRTSDVLQRGIVVDGKSGKLYQEWELDEINDTELIKHMRFWLRDWVEAENIPIIDGTLGVGRQKDAVIDAWVTRPEVAASLATLESVYQSRDYTLSRLHDQLGREIRGVVQVLLAPPHHFQQLRQVGGRHMRLGQLVPAENRVFAIQGLIDQGKMERVIYTYLLSRMALSGIVLSKEELDFFDSKNFGKGLPLQSPEKRFLRDALSYLRGAGAGRAREYLDKQSGIRELTHAELMAEKFYDDGNDEYKISGYNAELVSYLINKLAGPEAAVASFGAGTLLLQRKLKRGIDNIDFNPFMMDVAWPLASLYGGRKFVAEVSTLSEDEFPSESYDVVEDSFSLNWSTLETTNQENLTSSDRVRVLMQANRLLKEGGFFVVTVPEKEFTPETFDSFCSVLKPHFGFELEAQFSGKTFGRSKVGLSKRLGWSIVAKKVGPVDLNGLNIEDLRFGEENEMWVSTGVRQKPPRIEVQPSDYPAPRLKLEFDQYEIINDLAQVMILTPQDILRPIYDVLPVPEQTPLNGDVLLTPIVADEQREMLLRGETLDDYHIYRRELIRPASRILGLKMSEVDEIAQACLNALKVVELRRGTITDRNEAFVLIRRELERMARGHNNHHGK